MKKFIYKGIVLCILAMMYTASAFAETPTAHFNDCQLDIKGSMGSLCGKSVFAVITKSADKKQINLEDSNIVTDVLYTKENGYLEGTITLPDNLDNGKYYVFLFSKSGEEKTYFMYMSEKNVEPLITPVNQAKSADDIYTLLTKEENPFAIDLDAMEEYIPKIAEVFYEIKSGKTYKDSRELIHDYKVAEAVAMMRSGVKTETVLENYDSYFEADLTAYKGYSVEIKAKIDELLPAGNYSEKTAPQLYKEARIYSEIRFSADWNKLQEAVEKYKNDLVFDMSVYNLVTDKEEVYIEMYQNRANIKDFDSIGGAFSAAAQTIYDREHSNENITAKPGGNRGSGGGSSGIGGGAMNVSTNLVNNISQNSETVDETGLTDLSGHWAEKYIQTLRKEGIVSGFEDQTFRPDSLITRAEFTKLAVCAFRYGVGGKAEFTDVKESDWFSPYAASAYESGLVKGDDDGRFRPNDYITRQETATIIYRALKDFIATAGNDGNEFTDSEEISEYAKNAVISLFKAGVISGFEDGTFAPAKNTTRAEAAVMIYRAVYR